MLFLCREPADHADDGCVQVDLKFAPDGCAPRPLVTRIPRWGRRWAGSRHRGDVGSNRELPYRIGHAERDIGPARHAALQKTQKRLGWLCLVQVDHRAAAGAVRRNATEEDRLHPRQVQDVVPPLLPRETRSPNARGSCFFTGQKGHLDAGVA